LAVACDRLRLFVPEGAVSQYADSVEARLRLLWLEIEAADRRRRREEMNDEARR
jgi:hypothetical protein